MANTVVSLSELVHPLGLVRHAHGTLHKPDQTWYEEISADLHHNASIVHDLPSL